MDQSSATQPTPAEPAAAASRMVEIELEVPIQRGTTTIDRINLRRPGAGELRGLQVQALIQGDVNALLALLPRITVPPLTTPEVEGLEPVDLAAAGGVISDFFMSRTVRAAMAKVMGAIDTELSSG